MGSCEKCDDRASGRLDCDLTSERGERRGRFGRGVGVGGGKVTRDGGPRVRGDERDRHDRGRKSDAGGGNEDGPSAGEVGGMDVGPESERARQRELI